MRSTTLLLVVSLTTACGAKESAKPAAANTTTVTVAASAPTQARITGLSVDLPDGAVAAGSSLVLAEAADLTLPAGMTRLSPAYSLKASTAGTVQGALGKGAYIKVQNVTLTVGAGACVAAADSAGVILVWPKAMVKLVDATGGNVAIVARFTGTFQVTSCPATDTGLKIVNQDGYVLASQSNTGTIAGFSACDLRRASQDVSSEISRCRVYNGYSFLDASKLTDAATACGLKAVTLAPSGVCDATELIGDCVYDAGKVTESVERLYKCTGPGCTATAASLENACTTAGGAWWLSGAFTAGVF